MHLVLTSDVETKLCCVSDDGQEAGTVAVGWLVIIFLPCHIPRRSVQLKILKLKICSYSTTNNIHLLSQNIYSCKTLYMFRTVVPSIIRSSILRIQQRYMSKSCCYLLLSGMRWDCSPISSLIAAAV